MSKSGEFTEDTAHEVLNLLMGRHMENDPTLVLPKYTGDQTLDLYLKLDFLLKVNGEYE